MQSTLHKTASPCGEKAAFHNTLWSRVFAVGRSSDPVRAGQALEDLCQIYWYPVYVFLRRRGHEREQARDLTQGFFAYLIQDGLIQRADPNRGRFRSYLLGTLKHFVSKELERGRAAKRHPGKEILSLDDEDAEGRYANEPGTNLSPEKLFDLRWAMTVLHEAMDRLQTEYKRAGMEQIFDAVQPYLTGDGEAGFAELGGRLGKTENATRQLVFRLRNRFRNLIRVVIADTVHDMEQLEEELTHLQETLRGS